MRTVNRTDYPAKIDFTLLPTGSLFGAMSDQGIRFLFDQGQLLELQPGDRLFETGSPGDKFYIVCSGELRFYKVRNGQPLQTRSIGFGEEIGYVAMISLQPHAGRAVAEVTSQVLEISCDLYARLQERYPQDFGILTLNLARDMARNIQRLNGLLAENSIQH